MRRWAIELSVLVLPAFSACAPAATPAQPQGECAPMSRSSMIVEVVPAGGATLAETRDRVLGDVFGPDGYRVPGAQSCSGPVLHDTFSSIPAFAMLLTVEEAQRLRGHPAVRAVSADEISAPAGGRASDINPE